MEIFSKLVSMEYRPSYFSFQSYQNHSTFTSYEFMPKKVTAYPKIYIVPILHVDYLLAYFIHQLKLCLKPISSVNISINLISSPTRIMLI
jgi:hypothetical protein